MNKKELENKIEELKNKLTELQEELNKPESKCWKPKCGDTYYSITTNGEVLQSRWIDDCIDHMRYALCNCFRTEEEAEFESEKLKVIAELKRFAEEHNEPIDWEDTLQNKWFIGVYTPENTIGCSFVSSFRRNDIYFSSKNLARQAVEQIGEERIKKYYLGVYYE